MARQFFKVDGLKELDAALSELPKSTARSVLNRTLKKEGQPIADAGEAFAPKLTGELAISYTVGTKLSRRQRKVSRKESHVEVYVGPTSHPKSVQTEFGNAHQAPHPHMRPAWDGNWRQVLAGITSALAGELEKTRKRIARKAEREAAKLRAGL